MTRTSRSASTTLSLAAVFVAILASVACASGTRGPEAAPSLEAAPSRFATFDVNRVHYKSIETGREALVLVHGWSGDVSVWRFQVPELAKRARVIASQGRVPRAMQLFSAAVKAERDASLASLSTR